LGEHSGRYLNVVQRLLPLGFSIWVPDHRGHGQSGGKRGHVLDFRQYLSDIRLVVELAGSDLSFDQRCFLLGHSLGGLMALYYAQQHPEDLKGLVVSSPALGMVVEIPLFKRLMGSFMSRLWPGLSLGNELDSGKISHDPNVVRAYRDDPLVHERVSARFFTELLGAMATVNQQSASLRIPLIMQLAGDDHLVNAASAERFYGELKAPDKTLHVYPGFYHEIYNETQDRQEIAFRDLAAWLEERLRE
jgi:alpha-beta hydrolase superfamily lysophospholipase